MILVIDVGNTNIVLGAYEGEELIDSWRMTTTNERTSDETGIFIHSLFQSSGIDSKRLESVIISSVVPSIMYSLTHGIRKYFGIDPMIVSAGMKTGINLRMENPKELGSDRIVNMVAANEIYGGPAVVIDFGTATTYDVINDKGEFITCMIAPGIRISADALFQRAAQLPKIEIKAPKSIIAKTTVDCMQAGVVFSHVGETVYIINRLKKDLGLPNLKVIGTGGLARVINDAEKVFDYLDPMLTLKGLKILYEKNKRR